MNDTFCSTPGCLQRCPHTATECIQGMGTTVTAIKRDPLASRAQTESDSKATLDAARPNLPELLRARAQYNARKFSMPAADSSAKDSLARTSIEWEAADEIERLRAAYDRLRVEYEEVRFNHKHTKDSPQHGDDITLCGRDCEGRNG